MSFNDVQIERLGLTSENITLPAAIMLMDPEAYPTFSKARKESRKGAMLIHRGPLSHVRGQQHSLRRRKQHHRYS
jgi:hypothetical protein